MNDKRPVNLDIGTIALPITAYTSILHRVSGVFLVAGVALLFWLLGTSLDGPEGFGQAKACLASFWGKLSLWAVLIGLSYHSAAGVKHLVMDAGIGESMEGGETGAKLVLAVTAVLVVLAGLWIW
ncbi:MAG: succinate dehydrogenase, cytochrome b556 subunit [Zhongshania sp.]|uniref:succinate dehydrogenase, cytochrome b556 subunit n=1 Tax=Zhongshania sp. TaxID=1971902 RepID=UPI002638A2E4|nr:succinate dehydrogenase, cytochrome b556 subunit [Zhongshania sp.]MDF1691585.1 succinate dehydrogenase, cytochrome b556 subunit [Zhongshania sp.]